MFDHSPLYTTLRESAAGIKVAMQEVFITDFIKKLNPRRYTGPQLLVHLGKAGSYSEAVRGADPKMEMYDILREVDGLFQSRAEFRKALAERLNKDYRDDKGAEMLLVVRLAKHPKSTVGLIELMTFEYVSTAGWGD